MSGAGRQGAIVWAVSPFDVKSPFRVVQHDGSETQYADSAALSRDVLQRKIGPEFDIAVTAKLRPVLLLQDRPAGRFSDYAALSLSRVEKFDGDAQDRIRYGQEPALFYLGHNKAKYGLDKEYVVDLGSLHRVHTTVVVGGQVGKIDLAEFRTVCERLVRVSDFDISNLIVRKAAEFAQRLNEEQG